MGKVFVEPHTFNNESLEEKEEEIIQRMEGTLNNVKDLWVMSCIQ